MARCWRAHWSQRSAEPTERTAEFRWEQNELRTAAIILDGYAAEAGFSREELTPAALEREADGASGDFLARASQDLQQLITRRAQRLTGFATRMVYELLLVAMLVMLLYRFGRNFFYDSWLAVELGLQPQATPLLGTDFFIAAGAMLLLWCGLLLWLFTGRLRRGLKADVVQLAQSWNSPTIAAALAAGLERQAQIARAWREELKFLEQRVTSLNARITQPDSRLGHRTVIAPANIPRRLAGG